EGGKLRKQVAVTIDGNIMRLESE
ncbi:MAG: hypothetical protein QG670_1531, partial [Thermoproteota archaeon]|nr:hypothetical protein [Thermoproteota archaeon]